MMATTSGCCCATSSRVISSSVVVDERRLAGQCLVQRVEGGGARGESFAVARELEARVDADAPDVGEVVDVEAREVARLLRRAERAEGRSAISACSLEKRVRCAKRGPSGRNARPTMRKARLGSRRCRKRIAGSTVSA